MTILPTGANDQGRRLDRILRKALPNLPLSLIHRLLREGRVLVDGKPQGGNFRLSAGQRISLPVEGVSLATVAPTHLSELSGIIWEGPDLLVLNKAAGLEVHGAKSLDALVQAYLGPKLDPSLSFKPGPLHRLDKPTSGIVVFSASLEGARRFSALLRGGAVRKQYLAVVEGLITEPGLWEDALLRDTARRASLVAAEGKSARTGYTPLAQWRPAAGAGADATGAGGGGTAFSGTDVGAGAAGPAAGAAKGGYTLLLLEPATGRNHQIRVQAAAHGHPLAGDAKYGGRPPAWGRPGFLLHAWKLSITAEAAEDRDLLPPLLEAPLPDYFKALRKELFGIT
jgi:23S rRNA pseudouridine955/2504/2580 synthase